MQPLHIKIELGSPLSGFQTRPLYLDGLLTGLRAELFDRVRDDTAVDSWSRALELDDYLESFTSCDKRIWKASQLIPNWLETGQWLTKVRKTDPVIYMEAQDQGLLKARRTSTQVTAGHEKNYFIYQPIRWASHIDAWCVGDQEELSHLLNSLRSIGRDRKNGFGAVKGVTVSRSEEAEQKWRWRVMPEGAVDQRDPAVSYVPGFETVCPPYWAPLKRVACEIPILI